MGHARDVYQEGALIFPGVKVQRDHRDIGDVIRMCMSRIRVPEQWWGDYLAALGAVRIGERELLALGREVGWDALDQHAEEWFDYAEGRMRAAIGRLPAGRTVVATCHDPFPGVPDGIPLSIAVEIVRRSASPSICATIRTASPAGSISARPARAARR